jgi:hypothetical protein
MILRNVEKLGILRKFDEILKLKDLGKSLKFDENP